MKAPRIVVICLILGYGLAMESFAKPVKLSPADPVKDQWFGWSVAVNEKHAIVGSPKVDDRGPKRRRRLSLCASWKHVEACRTGENLSYSLG